MSTYFLPPSLPLFRTQLWQVALGLGVTLVALAFVGSVAKDALEEVEREEEGK